MANIKRHVVTIVTDAAGAGTGSTDVGPEGWIHAIRYVKVDYDNGVDFDVVTEGGLTVWDEDNVNASKTVYPRAATHTTLGVAAVYAAAGEGVLDRIPVAYERIEITVAQGGNVKSGTFHIYVGG